MIDARWWREGIAASSAPLIPVSSSADVHGVKCFYQHSRMAAVAVAPARGEFNREGVLMVAAVNGTIGPKPFATLYNIDQVAQRQSVEDFSSPARL